MRPVPEARPTSPADGRAALFVWHGRALYVRGVPVASAPHRHHAAEAARDPVPPPRRAGAGGRARDGLLPLHVAEWLGPSGRLDVLHL